ncbi:MAG: PAS domain S-box protein [Bacteroidales bacterium]|jgi:PAS domain S-box-containing protein
MKELNKLTKTELIREIKRLRKENDSFHHYQKLSKIAVDSIFLNKMNGDIIEVNEAACQNLGYSHKELTGMNINDIHPAYSAGEFEKFWREKQPEKQYLYETTHRKKDGTIFPVEVNAVVFTEEDRQYIIGIARDISQRKETEATLIESKAQLSNAMKIARLGYWEYDVVENYFYFNDQFYSIFKTTAEEVGGYKMSPEEYAGKFLHPDDIPIVVEETKEAIETSDPNYSRQIEHRIVYADGTTGYISVRFFIIKDDQGRTIKTFGANQDITDRKNVELAIIESEKRLNGILNNLQGMAYKCRNNREWNMEYISAGCKALTGYHMEELTGENALSFNEIIHPDHREKVWDQVQEAVKKGLQFHIEYKIIRKDKKEKWVMDRGSGFYNDDGKVSHIEGLITDITKIKETELELNKLSRAVYQAPALIIITDITGHIEYVNPKFTEVTGYSFEEVYRKNPNILKSGNHSKDFYKEMWKTILSGKTWSGEIVNKKKNKGLYWESALISPVMDSEGKITHFVAINEDITEKKRTEFELIKAKEKAEESDRLKSAFLSNMSHEIRTPMNGIIGFSSLLASKNLTQETTEYYKDLITKSSNQLLSIVNDIIDISKIVSDQVELNLIPVDLYVIMHDVSMDYKKKAKEKGLDYIVKKKLPENQSKIVTDPSKLIQILGHLLDNAIKFTKTGSVELGVVSMNKEVKFFVKDTGIGINKNMYDKVFQRFRQAEETHTREYGGTGLGLSISKAYVEVLGGKIWIESVRNKGTTFYFTLPCKKCTNKKSDTNEKDINISTMINQNWSDNTILIADDEPLVIDYFREVLASTGIKMHFARNGKETISFVKDNPSIDLVLLDIRMPLMNGFEVFDKIKKLRPDLPVIAQTAYAFAQDREKILTAGFVDYIAKPIHNNLLLEKIASYLKK